MCGRLRVRGVAYGAVCAALGTLALLLVQVVLFRQVVSMSEPVGHDAGQPGSWLVWAALAAFLCAVVVLMTLAYWGGTILYREPQAGGEGKVLSRVRQRCVLAYGLAGLLGMVAVACGAAIIAA